jgi:MFS family permease
MEPPQTPGTTGDAAPGAAPGPAAGMAAARARRSTPDRAGTRRPYLAVGVVALAVFLTALDQTVVVTALVQMIGDLGVPVTALDRAAWIVSGYLLGYVIVMPLMGRVADIYGRRRIFLLCLGIFALGSALTALAPTLGAPVPPGADTLGGMLLQPLYALTQQALALGARIGMDSGYPALNVVVAARFLQAVGGGALVPVALAVVGDLFGETRRGLALGLVGAVTEAGGVLGPLWGAWLTGTWGWQWIFWLNLPLAAVLFAAGAVAVPRGERRREGVDVVGAVLFGAAIACLTIGLGAQAGQAGALGLVGHAGANPLLLAVSAALLVAFVVVEARVRWPVIDPALFRRAALSAAAALSLLIGAALIVAMVMVPVFVITVLGGDPISSGLALLRMTALIPVGALAGGWLAGRAGCRVTASVGCGLTALGLWLMHLWPVHVGWGEITVAAVAAGLGFGLVIAPISTSALNAVRSTQLGSASALVTVMRMVGMIVGLAALTAWALARFKALLAPYPAPLPSPGESAASYAAQVNAYGAHVIAAAHQVYTDVFAVAAALCVVALVPAWLLWRRRVGAAEGERTAYESYVAPLA